MRGMKQTNIPWLREIPEGWGLGLVKDYFYRKINPSKQKDPIILSLTNLGLKIRDISNNEGQIAKSYEDYNLVEIGDLVMNPMDLISNAFAYVSKFQGVISPAYFNINNKQNANNYYYAYYFQLQYWNMSLFTHGKGVSFENRWTLNYKTFERFVIPIPPLKEQEEIARYLDEKCYATDKTIELYKALIEKLKEYKKSLIYECVTKGLDK